MPNPRNHSIKLALPLRGPRFVHRSDLTSEQRDLEILHVVYRARGGTLWILEAVLGGRIQSLAKTHLLLSDEARPVDFVNLLRSELDAFDDGSGRILLHGPEVTLPSQVAVSLGMAIHELTTNSAKYGALSVFGGRIDVLWRITIDATRRTLAFDWIENGGPPVDGPKREGFGSRPLTFVLPGQIQAKSHIDYAREGVRVHCTVPLPAREQ